MKNSNCTIGAGTRVSITTKATRATTDAANRPMIRGEPQPQLVLSTSARMSAVRPADSARMPGMSTRLSIVSSRDSLVANSVTATAAAATGTLM